ncbi:MAG: hypothetical protein JO033_14390 [Acidobacteriaceae bacterium]|nr:hypothetical protein [Acidobacteriaceae bacterium]
MLSILPEPGAKIYDLFWKASGQQILWQNPRIKPQRYPIDSNFDNYWCGGWDEGFPTCDACQYNGESYPNLGELRSVAWHVEKIETQGSSAVAELSAFGPISPAHVLKRVTLQGTSVSVRYQLANIGPLPFEFIWGSHPALAVTSDTVLHIPAKAGIVALSSSPALGSPGQRYNWPHIETPEGNVDMSRVQRVSAGVFCGHYALELHAGVYGVQFGGTGLALVVRFPVEQCPCLWMWLVYGGWRGYHHAIIEPWTSYPVNLAEAVKNGTHRSLAPGQTFCTEISVTVYSDLEEWRREMRRITAA